jgi:hypothetical protein
LELNPLGLREIGIVRFLFSKSVRAMTRERDFCYRPRVVNAREVMKAQESNRFRPELTVWEHLRDTAFSVGASRWSVGTKSGRVL